MTAWTAFDTVDIEWADEQSPGLKLTNTRHTFCEITCGCGHTTRQQPYRPNAEPSLPAIQSGEWGADWTLPDHFPPGMCLRVTTTGGTLSQGGQTLGWDDHGYYEVSLDAGTLTLVSQ